MVTWPQSAVHQPLPAVASGEGGAVSKLSHFILSFRLSISNFGPFVS
jgi:hypothetical protein